MKVLLIALVLAVLVSCQSPQQSLPTTAAVNDAILSTVTPSLQHATESTKATALPTPIGPIKWNVVIIQNGKVLTSTDGEFHLRRLPFTIRVNLSRPTDLALNVLDTDDNFKKVQSGSYAFDDCKHAWQTFCADGMALAEERFNKDEYLYIDTAYHEAYHWLYYNSPTDHRWSKVAITDTGAVFDRNVSSLHMYKLPVPVTIENYTGKLYLLFLAKYRPEQQIGEDELSKIVLSFEN